MHARTHMPDMYQQNCPHNSRNNGTRDKKQGPEASKTNGAEARTINSRDA